MIFISEILSELKLIRIALEKLANIEPISKQELPKNSKFELLDENKNSEAELERQLDVGKKAGFMFEEDAVDLELLSEE